MAVWIGDSPASNAVATIVDVSGGVPPDVVNTGVIDLSDYSSALIVLQSTLGTAVWEIDMIDNSGGVIPIVTGFAPGTLGVNGWGVGASGTPAQAFPGPLPSKIQISCPAHGGLDQVRVLIQAR